MENHIVTSQPEPYTFILFISGMSPKSSHALENLRRICDVHLSGNFTLEIIDINTDPQMALDYQILAIPTLIKIGPAPKRTILGDLSDMQKVLKILDINQ